MATVIAPATRLTPSFSQEQLWFLERLLPNRAVYNVPLAIRLSGRLDRSALGKALNALVDRHEQLRASFPVCDGIPQIHIGPRLDVHLRSARSTFGTPEFVELLTRTAREAFDLERGPLIRALLVECAPEDHVLLLTTHHIVTDGWSLGIIFDDLLAFYRAFARGKAPTTSDESARFTDYAADERALAQTGGYEASLEYWKSELSGAPRVELVGDRSPIGHSALEGSRFLIRLQGRSREKFHAFAKAVDATPTMLLLAAYAGLVARYTGEEDLVLGVPTHGRQDPAYERTVGYFVAMAALRIDARGEPSFFEMVERTRGALLDCLSQPPTPIQFVVERLSPQRWGLRNPLFSLAYVTQVPIEPRNAAGLRFETIPVSTNTAKFDLLLEATVASDAVTCAFEYATDLYDRPRIEGFGRSYLRLLEGALNNPSRPLSRTDLTTAVERARFMRAPMRSGERKSQTPIHRRFELWAGAHGGATALVFGSERTSYAALDEAANRIAQELRDHNIGRGSFVGICAQRSPLLVAAILGVMKCGAAYVPLDPAYPPQRLSFVAKDAALALLLVDRASHDRCADLDTTMMDLEEAAQGSCSPSDRVPSADVGLHDVAYVIYTSGSTGLPKGVAVTHGNVARLFSAADRFYDFGPSDVWTLFHSYAFDFSVWEMWGALAYGGSLVIVPADVARSPRDFHALLEEEQVTVLNQTPSAFYALIAADEEARPLKALRFVIFGGEGLEVRRLGRWFDRYGDERPQLVNMYGITETTVHVTYRRIRRDDERRALSPIGVPLPDLQIYLLDRHGAFVPDGAVGEIFVGGDGVAKGYLNRDELNRQKFLPDPFDAGTDGARMYRSGDLARRRFDGAYEYIGRADDQVKIRGFRIELGEVEAALSSHPDVARALVLVQGDPPDQRLCAYVVPRSETIDVNALRDHAAAALPTHMVPSTFAAVSAIPLTENGKLDRRALTAASEPLDASGDGEPAGDIERRLSEIFAKVLEVERVGVNDSFFSLGGHSLLAARLIGEVEAALPAESARLRTADGRSPLLATFYADPTVRGLGALLEGEKQPALQTQSIIEMRSGDPTSAPLFWFHGMYNGDGLYTWNLIEQLSAQRPVWVVHPHGYDNTPFEADIKLQAGERLQLLRTARPHGPYHLGGFCNSALVAYEIAVRLRDAGEEVASLILINPPVVFPDRLKVLIFARALAETLHLSVSARLLLSTYIRRYADRLDAFGRADTRRRLRYVQRALQLIVRKVHRLSGKLSRAGHHSPVSSYADPQFKNDRYALAIGDYLPPRYDGQIHIVWGDEIADQLVEPSGGWSHFAASAHAHVVQGGHFCPVENPRGIAAILRTAVEGAR